VFGGRLADDAATRLPEHRGLAHREITGGKLPFDGVLLIGY
jgi:hypothetical protein